MAEIIDRLEMNHITKRFPGVLALDDVTIHLRKGEILALLGENGAGKTTLMNVLYGLYHQDEGSVLINGQEVQIYEPLDALKRGIGMVHQHFMLVPNLTVLENIALGMYQHSEFKLDLERVRGRVKEVAERYNLSVKPDAYIWQLSVGEQQRVELVKVLTLGANVLILDEPTAALTPQQTDALIDLLRQTVLQDTSIIFISHKLNEVKAISDRVAVLRNGKLVFDGNTADHSAADLAEKMAGREIKYPKIQKKDEYGVPILQVQNVWADGDQEGTDSLQGLSVEVRAGEIVGVAGVSGNGQRELADAINGIRKIKEGRIVLDGEDISNHSPQQIIDRGMGYIPEDRLHEGTIPRFSVRENLIMKDYRRAPLSKALFLRKGEIDSRSESLVKAFNVKTPDIQTSCASLSGGNIQKVILAREITRKPKALLAAYPIRGLDIGASEYVHNQLIQAREEGMAVLLISEELDELLDLCDRIAVMYEGKILDVLPREECTKQELGLLMAGVAHGKE